MSAAEWKKIFASTFITQKLVSGRCKQLPQIPKTETSNPRERWLKKPTQVFLIIF